MLLFLFLMILILWLLFLFDVLLLIESFSLASCLLLVFVDVFVYQLIVFPKFMKTGKVLPNFMQMSVITNVSLQVLKTQDDTSWV